MKLFIVTIAIGMIAACALAAPAYRFSSESTKSTVPFGASEEDEYMLPPPNGGFRFTDCGFGSPISALARELVIGDFIRAARYRLRRGDVGSRGFKRGHNATSKSFGT